MTEPLGPPPVFTGDCDERDAWYSPGNNSVWGARNWVKCYRCPPDSQGLPVFHHRDYHNDNSPPADLVVEDDENHIPTQCSWCAHLRELGATEKYIKKEHEYACRKAAKQADEDYLNQMTLFAGP